MPGLSIKVISPGEKKSTFSATTERFLETLFLHLLSSGFFCLVSWNRLRKEFPNLESFQRLIDYTAHLARDLMGETLQTETTSPKTILQWTKINGEDIYIVFLLCFWPVRKLGVNHQSIAWHHAAWPLVLLLVVKVVYEGDHGNHRDHDGDPG